jgi:hypothetical protein
MSSVHVSVMLHACPITYEDLWSFRRVEWVKVDANAPVDRVDLTQARPVRPEGLGTVKVSKIKRDKQ